MTYRVLMVCTGNICRSAMAEVVLRDHLAADGAMGIDVDSVGISDEEAGNPIDRRAARVLREAGYSVPVRQARQISADDLDRCDLILAMTRGHFRGVELLAQRSGRTLADGQLRMYRSFDPAADSGEDLDVPDPWYGGPADFEETLRTIEDVTPALARYLEESHA